VTYLVRRATSGSAMQVQWVKSEYLGQPLKGSKRQVSLAALEGRTRGCGEHHRARRTLL
jgi:hypothetical protein